MLSISLNSVNARNKDFTTFVYEYPLDISIASIEKFLKLRTFRKVETCFLSNEGKPFFSGERILLGNDTSARILTAITGIYPKLREIPIVKSNH